jgi:hypothetical protein
MNGSGKKNDENKNSGNEFSSLFSYLLESFMSKK